MDAMCLVFFFQHIFFGIRSLCVSHFTCGSSRAGLGKTSSLRDVDRKYAPAPQRQSLCSKMAHLVGLAHLGGMGILYHPTYRNTNAKRNGLLVGFKWEIQLTSKC